MTISVVLADDQEMVRIGLAMILEHEGRIAAGGADDSGDNDSGHNDSTDRIAVVAQCVDGVEAVEAIRAHRPDVALLDIRMPRLDGLEVTRLVAPLTRVVIVTTFGDDDLVDAALDLGACGFVLKDAGPALLVAAVRAAARGDALISPEVTLALLRRRAARHAEGHPSPGRAPDSPAAPVDARVATLSPRERHVVQLVARGLTNAEIAGELGVGVATVKTHLVNVSARLRLRNRVEIAALAWSTGLVR